jgi:CRP-like cAMP-binding protein
MKASEEVIRRSEKMYAQLVEVYPTDHRFLRKYADILIKLDKPAQAEKVYEKLHALLLASGDKQGAREIEQIYPSFAGDEGSDEPACEAGFLSFLDVGLMDRLVMRLKQRTLKEGSYLFRFGEQGESMFVVIEGSLAAMLPGGEDEKPVMLNLLKRGDVVGEMAMLRRGVRSADVVAASDCKLFELERKSLVELMAQHGELESSMLEEAELRHRVTQISHNRILARLPLKDRRKLAKAARTLRAKHQHRIAEGGSLIQHVLLVTKGVADAVYENYRGESYLLHDLQAGDMLGMNALLGEASHPADVVAATDMQLLELPLGMLRDYTGAYPWLRLQLEKLIETNMSKTMSMIERIRNVREL